MLSIQYFFREVAASFVSLQASLGRNH